MNHHSAPLVLLPPLRARIRRACSPRQTRAAVAAVLTALACASCSKASDASPGGQGRAAADASGTSPAYVPRVRPITVTTIPLLVREQQRVFPFLKESFAKGGVLDGHEVYAFSPSTIAVVVGDTIHFTFVNPEDDPHSFVLPDFSVSLPGQTTTTATYVAKRPGIFPIVCAIQGHMPMMSGQLVVLAAAAVASPSP